jgi:hypothetical protein
MTSLRIEDLDGAETLDGLAMSRVRGGMPALYMPLPFDLPTSFGPQQVVGQSSVVNNLGAGFAAIVPTQTAVNSMNFLNLPSPFGPSLR